MVDLAVAAARRALDAAGVAAGDVDAWFLATSTPSHVTSSAAARVARRLGSTALAIELRGGGAGALQAVALACTCGARRAVVVAAEALSPLLDPGAVSASLLYADGAAALVLGAEPGGGGLYGARLGTAEVRGVPFTVPGRLPPTAAEVEAGAYRFRAPDREYQAELERVWDHAADALRPLLLEGAVFAPYPVTLPLAQRVAERLAVPWPRVSFPLAEHGCIGAAGVLSAWHHARAADARQPVGALAVGGGVTWGAISWAP